mgnify:CR=1 FL=1
MAKQNLSQYIHKLETEQMKSDLPTLNVGDTVEVSKEILEGKKKRIQKYEGLIIKKHGIRSRQSVTVRKISNGVGVEKTFLIHSPLVVDIKVKSRGKVRRSKLFYLRDRIGKKATRVKLAD